ncbi:MAG: adenylate/guanylate cyclase domain-containing protein [Gammaproteobacteria bacterium]|nr:adenylate/guanylate cyclase domain-containing protein [Gammaproteobacteria bacterium]
MSELADVSSSSQDFERELQAIEQWLMEEALGDIVFSEVFPSLCERLAGLGVSIIRAHVAMGSLHPMVSSTDITWWRGKLTTQSSRGFTSDVNEQWQRSPLRAVVEGGLEGLRFRLDEPGEWSNYPVLHEFVANGATDYLVLSFGFTARSRARDVKDGAVTSWVSNRIGGFTDSEVTLLRRVAATVAVLAKISKREQTLVGLVSAYLGSEAGRRVLNGQIRRGDLETIPAVIWYSDMRRSTSLAESLSSEDFLLALNDYFESTASAVLDHGGEVLRFIGDAVLAIFPVSGVEGAERWARVALAAAVSAQRQLRVTNSRREAQGQPSLDFGLGLHVGDVQFGNIGTEERLEFSVVGPAANKVCRIEGLTKELGEGIVVSGEFAGLLTVNWRSLGVHQLQGIALDQELFAPPTTS